MRRILIVGMLLFCHSIVFADLHKSDEVKIANLQNAVLKVDANIYFGDNDEEKVPIETEFFLLPKSIVNILNENGFKPTDEDGKIFSDENSIIEALGQTLFQKDDESGLLSLLIWQTISKKQLATIRLDKFGSAHSKPVKTGSYYLFGVKRIKDEMIVWNLPVFLSIGSNRIELDQYNAESVVRVN